ncbi:MAG: hypothetical protein JSW52_07445 [Candidatus Coatesbacteria bacterium]|nr:MAG: hypothetical protein JSW52_07445 [Candidatus Coatesbacteria bacterium]
MGLDFKPLVPIFPTVILSVVAVAAAVWGAWLIYASRKRLGATAGTAGIRAAVVAIFALSLLGMRSAIEKAVVGDKPVVVLVDCSFSMDSKDAPGVLRGDSVSELYGEIINVLEDADADTRSYLYADGLYALYGSEPRRERIPARRRSSSGLAFALDEVAASKEPVAAVIISDGTRPEIPAPAFPVYVFSPSTEPASGVYPVSVETPRYVLPGTRFPLEITFAGSGEIATGFSVYEDSDEVAKGVVTPGVGVPEATVYLTAEIPGIHFYKIEADDGRATLWAWTEVVQGPVSVYYRCTWADPDATFLKRAVAANKQIECDYRQDLAGGKSIVTGPGFGPAGADVIVLANPRSEFIDAGFAGELDKRVADGAGLLIYYSVYPPDTRVLSIGALAALSPLRPSAVGTLVSGVPKAAPGAETSGFRPSVVPEFDYALELGDPKPFTTSIWESPGGAPTLSWIPYGCGKVMLLAGGGLAGWELSRSVEGSGLDAFAADLVLFLYGGEETVTVSDRVVEVNERTEVYVLSTEEPTVVAAGPDNKPVRMPVAESDLGVWTAVWDARVPGLYTVTARRFSDGGLVVEKTDVYVTERFDGEIINEQGVANLIKLAGLSGGGFDADGPDDRVVRDVSETLKASTPSETLATWTPLFPLWLGLTVFLGLLSVEWITRRLSGLA